MKNAINRRLPGWESLGYAMVTQAVEDYKFLAGSGIVNGRRLVKRRMKRRRDIHNTNDAKEVIIFLTEDLDYFLDLMGSTLDGETIRKRIGL